MAFLVQQSFNGGEVSPDSTARSDQVRYQTGALLMRNAMPKAIGPCTRRPGTHWLGWADEQDAGIPMRLVPFVFSEDQARMLEFSDGKLRVWANGALVAAPGGGVLEVTSPYLAADLADMRCAQSADVVYIASRNHPPRKLMRLSDTSWQFQALTFLPSITAPTGVSGTPIGGGSGTNYKYVVTAVSDATGEESLQSATVTVNNASSLSQTVYNRVQWTAVSGALEYRVYRERSGVFGFIGRAVSGSVVFDDLNLSPDVADTPPAAENPFSGAGNYPAKVFFWEQRLGWASTGNNPLSIWMSQSALLESLAASRPPADDDAIELRMVGARQNEIMWLVPDRYLAVGTSGAELTLVGMDDGPLTPSGVRFVLHGERGSANTEALRAGGALLYVQRGGRVVREFVYNFGADKYDSPEMTVWVPHLFHGRRVAGWAYQQSPHSIVWLVMSDGALLGLTYLREHEVVAWHRHDTDGFVEQVECIPGPDGDDELWLVVRRQLDGVTRRCIERLAPFADTPTPANAYHVDCGLSYSGDPVSALTGLDHLEGRTVSVLADGYVHPQVVVTEGQVLLERPAPVIHVGLPYTSVLVPTRPEYGLGNGTTMTRIAKINKATLRVRQSMGVRVGPDEAHLYYAIKHNAADPMAPPFASSDDVAVTIDGGWTSTTTLRVQVDDPTPCTVVAIVYDITMSSNTGSQL